MADTTVADTTKGNGARRSGLKRWAGYVALIYVIWLLWIGWPEFGAASLVVGLIILVIFGVVSLARRSKWR